MPGPGRHGHRPHPSSPPPGQVPAASWAVLRGGDNRTLKHQAWVRVGSGPALRRAALNQTLAHYLATVDAWEAAVDAIEADLLPWCGRPPFARRRATPGRLPGHHRARRAPLCSEVCDWRRFPTAGMFMGFTALVPSEHSSECTSRGGITHAGNTHLGTQLVESAWSYKCRPQTGDAITRRQEGLEPAVVAPAWAAQLRLCGKLRRLDARKTNPQGRRRRHGTRARRVRAGGDGPQLR